MRALGYARLQLTDGGSLDEIERAFKGFCQFNLHQAVKTFASGGDEQGLDSPEYRRMVEYIQGSGSGFLVAVPTAAHLGSDLESVSRSIIELDRVGANVVCWDEEFPNIVQNAFQTLGIRGVSRTRSRNIKASMRARALRGQALGRPPFGYRIGPSRNLEIVKAEAPVVELIYRLYTKDDLGFRLIAQHLNERGIGTRNGGNWNVVSIRDILRNPAYMGTYTRLGMRRSRAHEAIIPAGVFRASLDQTSARRPVGRVVDPKPFLLSGLIYCSYCGNKMQGVTRRQSWKRKDGRRVRQVYRYYQCQSRNNQSVCAYHTWREGLLEATVLAQLGYALEQKGRTADDSSAVSRRKEVLEVRQERLKNSERLFLQALRRVGRGEMSVKVLGEYLDELDAARRAVADAGRPAGVGPTLANWDTLDMEARREFLAENLVRVSVEDDRIEVEV